MDAESLLRRVGAAVGAADDGAQERLADVRTLPARAAITTPLPSELPDVLAGRLRLAGIDRLYQHQAEAIAHIQAGQHVIVATGTASGKSLCYQVPIMTQALLDSRTTALYLSPTKALARDQLRQLRSFRLPHVRAAVYDGDTPRREREAIRRTANVVLTNPDMLHVGILPGHRRWQDFLHRLGIIVIDECHVARGVFGSHVAAVIRRLLRLTDHYSSAPVVVFSSATIGNPAGHARALSGLDVRAVTTDASPSPRRAVALWSPPLTDPASGKRRSTLLETSDILAELVRSETAALAFVKSRKGAELIAGSARRRLGDAGGNTARILAYRAGLLPEERRRVEQGLIDGTIRGVAATDALELGVDVGQLDAVVVCGWPGTVASLWQQAGRAGRRGAEAVIVFVGDDDPLDRFLLNHPDELFGRPLEEAVIDVTNPYVLAPHLGCAAAELPLTAQEHRFAPADVAGVVAQEEEAGRLRSRGGRWFFAGGHAPAARVDLRSAGGPPVTIVDAATGALIGEVDRSRAPRSVHTGAVYLHQGRPWRVRSLGLDEGVALADPDDGTTTTSARSDTDIRVMERRAVRRWGPCHLSFGEVEVSTQVLSYERKLIFTGESLGVEPLDLPPQRLVTRALWITLSDASISHLPRTAIPGAAHAAEHAAIGLLPLFAMCDRWDIGGVSTARHSDTGVATIFIYDGYPGGAGIAERGFDTGDQLWRTTRSAIRECPCADGCPSCIQSPKCGNGNEPLDKRGAVRLLDVVLKGHAQAAALHGNGPEPLAERV